MPIVKTGKTNSWVFLIWLLIASATTLASDPTRPPGAAAALDERRTAVFQQFNNKKPTRYLNLTTEGRIEAAGVTLPYRLFSPQGATGKLPLVLVLHGAGHRGEDNRKPWYAGGSSIGTLLWISDLVQKDHPCFVVAPQVSATAKWVDTDWEKGSYDLDQVPVSKPMQAVMALLDKLEKELPIDPQRIYVTGLSMGGFGTWDLALRQPERFAAIVPVCGGASPKHAARLAKLPVWCFHGDKDNVVPYRGTQEMAKALADAGGAVRFTTYPGVQHGSWSAAYAEPDPVP
jgi:predicted peptidase